MDFWQFVFRFLYVRNWYTGKMELSRPRVLIFSSGVFLLLLALTIVTLLQAPVEYETL
jgi:hypothetical protein